MKRKVVSVILATAMVASMVAGCGGSNNAQTMPEQQPMQQQAMQQQAIHQMM